MIEIENIFVIIGITLVVFFATLLVASKRYKSRPNKFLALSLLMLAVIMLKVNALLEGAWIMEIFELLRVEYLFSVFLYIYVCLLLKEKIKRFIIVLLWMPFLFFSTVYSIVNITNWFGNEILGEFLEQLEPFEIYAILLFNSIVIAITILKIKNSEHDSALKKWMYLITFGMIGILCLAFALECIELLFDVNAWSSLGFVMSIFCVAITYYGVQKLQVQQEQKHIQHIYSQKKQVSSASKSSKTLGHYERMKALMEVEELFRNSNLDRSTLAEKLHLSESSVTRILKEEGQLSFKDFVNQYRIQLAKKMLNDSQYNVFSLEAIGKEVGFKSRSTFYNTFKKEVGISPGEFKKK